MMKYEMAKYDAYKDSGVEWLGEVPEYWKISRIKEKGSVKARVGWKALKASEYVDDGFAFLSTPNIKNKDIDFKNVNCITYERYVESPEIILKEDDILLAKDGSTLGIVNIVTYLPRETTVNSSIGVLRFDKTVFNKYLFYQIESKYIQDKIQLKKGGMGVPHLFQQDINNFIIFIPPLPEQNAIAAYLDTKTVQIDRKIDLLTKKATQYGKLKQSLINETVTRGLDRSVAMKDSGVERLGDVPEHWKVNRLKNLAYIKTGGKDTIDNVEEGTYPFFVRSQTIERINSYSFDGEAILTAGDGVGVGKVFHHVNCKFDYHQRVYKISNFRNVVGKFIFYYMRENFHKDALRLNAKSTVDSLRMPMFQNFTIAFGDIEEQQAIVDYLDTKTAKIDRIVETINTQIEKLKELRKTLINDVVTGKIKVPQ